jgi:cytoskeletal protein CcmA (bactofilin family)
MFRRTDDSDWSRFAKGGNREREDAPEAQPPADAADLPPTAPVLPGVGVPRPPTSDLNVTLTRPVPSSSPPAPPAMAAPGASDQVETVVGRESSIQGTMRSEQSIRIQGAAQGEIESKQAVYVEDSARVNAKIVAAEITISGQLDGQVFSSGRVEIRPSGRVTGEIHAPTLVMHEGAFFDGQLKMKDRGHPDAAVAAERDVATGPVGRRMPPGGSGGSSTRNPLPSS